MSWLQSSRTLSILSLILHSTLVLFHLVLVAVWSQELEHTIVFSASLDTQKIVSFLITAITTTLGTIYSALLLFLTQKLSSRRSLNTDQTLTATHDSAAAWAGVGSAISHVWHQKTVFASLVGVLSAFLYLANILILHVTTSSLLSLQTFNASRSVPVVTQSLPAFNFSGYNWSVEDFDHYGKAWEGVLLYGADSLYSLPSVLSGKTNTIGLHGGTLYDVLGPNLGVGNVTVNATGFNITCGYPTDLTHRYQPQQNCWGLQVQGTNYCIKSTGAGLISSWFKSYPDYTFILYSTGLPIIDSSNKASPWINLEPPMNTSVSSIQVLRCSQSLVSQTAVVDLQTQKVIEINPPLEKNTSTWLPYMNTAAEIMSFPELLTNPAQSPGSSFINAWEHWYTLNPYSDMYSDNASLTYADLYLIQKLNLLPVDGNGPPNITLHELENALSILVASIFWTLGVGHMPTMFSYRSGPDNPLSIGEGLSLVQLQKGTAVVTEFSAQTRLDLSIIAIGGGLVVSVVLMLVSLQFSHLRHGMPEEDILIDGTGLLHIMWLYRNHPELETVMEQVDRPTDRSLRKAGMVRTMLKAPHHQFNDLKAKEISNQVV
ncbi:hypothetical protein MVEN_02503100 [Mycena venus]|uniref:Uncharacterized protein n=1 Tax=Mycena venus TaxID=2733690 RepID=A0A8H6U468_9AGAR|nr:hypothetical protein MVEN_02503100 [Mycena venus]